MKACILKHKHKELGTTGDTLNQINIVMMVSSICMFKYLVTSGIRTIGFHSDLKSH